MPKKKVLILKLGGSIVTLKHLDRPAVRRIHIKKIATIIRKYYDPAQHTLILIHGAGSFGHVHAHNHDLSEGTRNHPEKMFRAVENQSLDAYLNSEITKIFIQAGLPVVGMPTRTLATNTNGKLSSLETQSIQNALQAGAIPLLHGDMIFDTAWGLSICSGDVLMAKLAQIFSAKNVFFASDVDGIFTRDPHQYTDATLIQKTTLGMIINGTIALNTSHNIDVTGGLSKKFSLFQRNTPLQKIYLFNGLAPKNFSFLFDQSNFFGTTIEV
jgi:isopentenyl phosphate kinase